ncbi:AraC family transcriptional regulator [Erythrobacter rubeus]|uniref:Helix-turn-helix transcriptional regulator n=1 Tax=Erythrobacter rubeus TaxID=2760803 RepID=A0ABR8KNM4_9SPHN|nr:AraC family transcriptional regulator [Erythrobacter rubeus]MBD2840975.1 helix-turn-helix transcriptional regulator [Erythrobacter rubeus]
MKGLTLLWESVVHPSRPNPAQMVHPDVAEPLSIDAIGDRHGRPFKEGRPPGAWKSDNLRRIEFDGFDLTYLCGEDFELEFDARGHLIDFNFNDRRSVMRVNGQNEELWEFGQYTTSFAPTGTGLYRKALSERGSVSPHRLIGLNFSPDYLDILVSDILDGGAPVFVEMGKPCRWPRMDRIQSALLALFEAPHVFSKLTAEALVNDTIMRALLRWSSVGNQMLPNRFKTDDAVVGRAIQFIASNLTQSVSLADIARAAERDATILVHVFKLATGRTPYAYLLASRIDAAKHDLRSTRKTIAEIADRYRFGSPSHFSTTFRKLTGASPSEFRAKQ